MLELFNTVAQSAMDVKEIFGETLLFWIGSDWDKLKQPRAMFSFEIDSEGRKIKEGY